MSENVALSGAGVGVGGHHPAYELQSVIVLDKTHPITAGVEDFDVHDEQHFTFIDEHRGYTHRHSLPQRHSLRKRGLTGKWLLLRQGAAAAEEPRLEWP